MFLERFLQYQTFRGVPVRLWQRTRNSLHDDRFRLLGPPLIRNPRILPDPSDRIAGPIPLFLARRGAGFSLP